MLFELIDTKKICDSCFIDGRILPFVEMSDLTHTWDYSSLLGDDKYELACLYAKTKNIEDACSHDLRERYLILKLKMKSFLKSCITAHISLDENCLFDIVPISFLEEFFSVRKEIMQEIFESNKRPENYDFLYGINKLIYNISESEVRINLKNITENKDSAAHLLAYKAAKKVGKQVKYNVFGSVTGRLTTSGDSFPILTLPKAHRSIVEPTNDFLLELDFNAFEPRIMMALNEKPQVDGDLHEWNRINIFLEEVTRDESKKKFLSWLYDEKGRSFLTPSQEGRANSYYNKSLIKKTYYNGNLVKNYYGRSIMADAEHSLNYIVQSSASDCFLRQAVKAGNILSGKKSFIKFLIHDSIVVDMSLEDKSIVRDICETFSNTDFGKFMINKKIGKNFGGMKSTN